MVASFDVWLHHATNTVTLYCTLMYCIHCYTILYIDVLYTLLHLLYIDVLCTLLHYTVH